MSREAGGSRSPREAGARACARHRCRREGSPPACQCRGRGAARRGLMTAACVCAEGAKAGACARIRASSGRHRRAQPSALGPRTHPG